MLQTKIRQLLTAYNDLWDTARDLNARVHVHTDFPSEELEIHIVFDSGPDGFLQAQSNSPD